MAENDAKITFASFAAVMLCNRLKLPAVFGLMLSPLAGAGHAGGHSGADMTMHHNHVMIGHAVAMARKVPAWPEDDGECREPC